MHPTSSAILASMLVLCVAWVSMRVNGIAESVTPPGFTPLFDGHSLVGWRGLVEPPARAKMSRAELITAQRAADERMREHWSVQPNGLLAFDGHGENLCAIEEFTDFELLVDWKIPQNGDSGIYLRGTPQVQIWDNPIGSGGLYNNKHHPSGPLVVADRPRESWNRFRIVMRGETVSVWLNSRLVVDRTPMENYWEPNKPVYPRGSIELQAHGGPLWFRNIFVKRLDS